MKRLLVAGTVLAVAFGLSPLAEAQAYPLYPPPFQIRPAMPESMPTVLPNAGIDDPRQGRRGRPSPRPRIAAPPTRKAVSRRR